MERNNFKWKTLEKNKRWGSRIFRKKQWYDKKNSYRFWLRKVNYFTFDFRAYWIMWKNNINVFREHISLPKKFARFLTRSDLGYVEERKVLSKRVEKLFDFRYYSTSSQPSHIRLCQALWLMCHEEVKLIFILSVVIPHEIYDFLWRFFHLYHCASHLLEVGVSPALLA